MAKTGNKPRFDFTADGCTWYWLPKNKSLVSSSLVELKRHIPFNLAIPLQANLLWNSAIQSYPAVKCLSTVSKEMRNTSSFTRIRNVKYNHLQWYLIYILLQAPYLQEVIPQSSHHILCITVLEKNSPKRDTNTRTLVSNCS